MSTATFGELLRRYRVAMGFSQEGLADVAHVSVESVGALERGVRKAPYRGTVDLLATALQLSLEERANLEAAAASARVRVDETTSPVPIPVTPLAAVDVFEVDEMRRRVDAHVDTCTSLQDAAARFVDVVYERFASTAVLVRVFATVEYQQLDLADRALAARVAAGAIDPHRLDDGTPVLALLATRGMEAEWNDRRRSRDHRAIPLISRRQVAATPMISRLLEEIGFVPEWRGSETSFVLQTLASVNGIFYVGDAGSAVDDLGRKIIPATTFVEHYGVKTVFGFGGSYDGKSMSVTAVVFCRHPLPRAQAARFVPLIALFKARTAHLVDRGAIFSRTDD